MTDKAAAWRDAAFRKSSFSGSSGGNCVEVGFAGSLLGVRDSKNTGPVIAVCVTQGHAFLAAVKHGHIGVW